MKLLLIFTTTTLLAAIVGTFPATFVDHKTVNAALAKGGGLIAGPGVLVSGSHRTAAGQVEMHEKQTDVLYVTDGHATFITGGTMIGGKVSSPGQWLGASIQGGETHTLDKGDVIMIPAGTPHWFREVPQSISYFVVKALKP